MHVAALLIVAALLALVGGDVKPLSWRKRAIEKALVTGDTSSIRSAKSERFVDMGLVVRVVRMDLAGGTELIEGCPPMVVIDERRFGGMVDTHAKCPDTGRRKPRLCGGSRSPHVIYVSEKAAPYLFHDDTMPSRLLLYGSEGVGKTRLLAQWLIIEALLGTGSGHVLGCTSPTTDRAEEVKDAIEEMMPAAWFQWNERTRRFRLRNGIRIALKSTHQPSRKEGSRMQSHNFRACASDEIQDSLDHDSDIEMRGRKAPLGRYKRFCTATSKDSSRFRTWREERLAARDKHGQPLWHRVTLLGPESPFVWPQFWEEKAELLSKREYKRRILAEDVPSENRVYYGFERERNVIVEPQIGRDITEEVASIFRPLRVKGARFPLIAGHDPGEIRNVTHFLRALWHRDRILWLVVGRFITERTTAEQHAAALVEHVRQEYGLNAQRDAMDPDAGMARVLVLCDPHGRGETKTDFETVHLAFMRYGLDIYSAAGADDAVIKRSARIGMMNRLLHPEVGEARLCIVKDERQRLAAPELVDGFEQLERDDFGRAEAGPKNEHDMTHHPVSVGYALWPFEAEAVSLITRRRAAMAMRSAT